MLSILSIEPIPAVPPLMASGKTINSGRSTRVFGFRDPLSIVAGVVGDQISRIKHHRSLLNHHLRFLQPQISERSHLFDHLDFSSGIKFFNFTSNAVFSFVSDAAATPTLSNRATAPGPTNQRAATPCWFLFDFSAIGCCLICIFSKTERQNRHKRKQNKKFLHNHIKKSLLLFSKLGGEETVAAMATVKKSSCCAICDGSNLTSICAGCVNHRLSESYASLRSLHGKRNSLYARVERALEAKKKMDNQLNWRLSQKERTRKLKERLQHLQKELFQGAAVPYCAAGDEKIGRREMQWEPGREVGTAGSWGKKKQIRGKKCGNGGRSLDCAEVVYYTMKFDGEKKDGYSGPYDLICHARLPRGLDPHSVPPDELAASLGYLIQLLNLVVPTLAAPVLHTSGFAGSSSRIWQRDSYWAARPSSQSKEYPLFIPRQNLCSSAGDTSWSERSSSNFGVASVASEKKPLLDFTRNSSFNYSATSPHSGENHKDLQKGISLLKKSVACITAFCNNLYCLGISSEASTFEAFAKALTTLSSSKEMRTVFASKMKSPHSNNCIVGTGPHLFKEPGQNQFQPALESKPLEFVRNLSGLVTTKTLVPLLLVLKCAPHAILLIRSDDRAEPLNKSTWNANPVASTSSLLESVHSMIIGNIRESNFSSSAASFLYTADTADTKKSETLVDGWDLIEHPILPPPSQAEDIEHWTRAIASIKKEKIIDRVRKTKPWAQNAWVVREPSVRAPEEEGSTSVSRRHARSTSSSRSTRMIELHEMLANFTNLVIGFIAQQVAVLQWTQAVNAIADPVCSLIAAAPAPLVAAVPAPPPPVAADLFKSHRRMRRS
ncbi:hypothetical protein AXF42_Ash010770 [Apostasia shenzhenica]|uniref:Uncharacterized protein n=1 Tax=Apostasia shenzhenica TaxID=1088818 RepID=A0A2I0A0M1_9ASPA|nr:hypothetical protein AXF42_Ash010770 [Apostasia shenzhenica]